MILIPRDSKSHGQGSTHQESRLKLRGLNFNHTSLIGILGLRFLHARMEIEPRRLHHPQTIHPVRYEATVRPDRETISHQSKQPVSSPSQRGKSSSTRWRKKGKEVTDAPPDRSELRCGELGAWWTG